MTLKYSVIRFCPRAGRGELLNVGVVVIDCSTRQGRVALSENRRRLRAIGERDIVDSVLDYLVDWKEQVESGSVEGREIDICDDWLNQYAENGNNLLQFSAPAPVLFDNIPQALTLLRKQFLPRNEVLRTRPVVTRRQAVAALRHAYNMEGLERGVDFVERPLIKSKNYSEVMDFAVANGEAVQLAQSWNFQTKNVYALIESVKAWAWTINDIREHGGKGTLDSRSFSIPREVDVEAVYIDPVDSAGGDALEESLHAFKEIHAKARTVGDADNSAKRAKRALAHA